MTEPPSSALESSVKNLTSCLKLRKMIAFDMALIMLLAMIVFFLSSRLDVFEFLVDFVAEHHHWELDEFFIVGNFLLFAGVVFFMRRFRETRRLLRERDALLHALRQSKHAVKSKQMELRRAALIDPLTGLANRGCLMGHLEKVFVVRGEDDPRTAILYFDLDRFKQINDLHGHLVGDELLREVARRIQDVLGIDGDASERPPARLAARLGGDEFVAVVRDVASTQDIRYLANTLLHALGQPYTLNGISVTTTASIGVVVSTDAYETTKLMLGDADAAMYEAKNKGRGQVVFFERSMREHLQRRIRLDVDLRGAIDRQEFHVVYHPIVSLVTGRMDGVEALLRWTHPEFGPISPGEFVPIAEDSEFIYELGTWVLKESLRQMAEWLENYPNSAPELISVNVSRKQFSDQNVVEKFRAIIEESTVPPDRIQLEITEDMHGEMDAMLQIAHELKDLGIRLAIDDFGTGTSTFSAIERFPIDTLKIDLSLVSLIVSSMDRAAIVHSLAMLVRNLDVKLVAEGVENAQQVTVLQDLGCNYAQGWLFCKPLPAREIETMFAKSLLDDMTVTGVKGFPDLWSGKLRAFQPLAME